MGGTGKKGKTSKNGPVFVSVLTPTYNRRPFVSMMIACFQHQTYPMDQMEWLIADDGTDPIGDLVQHLPQVRYLRSETKMTLGEKRNWLNKEARGEILVNMDDDDYYPPERVAHAVEVLQSNPQVLIAGSSKMYMYYADQLQIVECGPYWTNHATAATFAYRRALMWQTRYDGSSAITEEKYFLKNYRLPLVQLDSEKTILVLVHRHNTVDKYMLLENGLENHPYMRATNRVLSEFVSSDALRTFITVQLPIMVSQYTPGLPENKEDAAKAMDTRKQELRGDVVMENYLLREEIGRLRVDLEKAEDRARSAESRAQVLEERMKAWVKARVDERKQQQQHQSPLQT